MDSQDNIKYMFQQGSKPRYIPRQNTSWWPPASRMAMRGGTAMIVTLSDQSTHSNRSGYSDATDQSFPSATTMSSSYDETPVFDYEPGNSPSYLSGYSAPSSFNPGSFGQISSASFGQLEHERRETPSTLGWAEDSVLVKLYTFIVMKGKEPYLELQSNYRVTSETPERVYLDAPRYSQKGLYPCQFPGCQTKKPFNRPADLDRHYRNVHASEDQRERYECDYSKCDRAQDPFTRKDHYRDHLRDYHKEDLGQAKRAKKEDRQKWERAQKAWLAERNINPNWWRCAKCLSRVHVHEEGWECHKCNGTCEPERKASRRQIKGEEPDAYSYNSTTASFQPDCSTCDGAAWIDNGNGSWAACPNCNLMTESQDPTYDTETWDNGGYNISFSSY